MTEAEALAQAAARLAAAGIDPARREARLLLGLALDRGAAALLASSDRTLSVDEAARFEALVARRAAHEPYSRIVGKREFWSREFALSPDTLDPRPDSETLIEAALTRLPDRAAPWRLLDFGTGTGALLLALLTELPNAQGIGVDIAPGAVETARRNAAALGLSARARFVTGDWGDSLSAPADVILANPPYIPTGDLASLAPEVAGYDPRLALDGGRDGFAAYRQLAPEIARLLTAIGFALCEVGVGQGAEVSRIMARAGLELIETRRDLAGIDRCFVFERRKTIVNRKIKA